MLTVRKISLLCIMLLLAAASRADEKHTDQQAEECIPIGQVLLPATGKTTNITTLIKDLSTQQVVLLGEHHDNLEHHRWQLQSITGFHVLHPDLILGFEMFPRKAQPILDRWVAGELSEKTFLKEVQWAEYWRFDSALYLPLFHYARMNRIPMIALNVERSLISDVGEKGWENIPIKQREGVSTPKSASQGYRELLANVFMHHGDKSATEASQDAILNDPSFNRFVGSQSVWDRAMAEGINNGLQQYKGAMMLAVVGSGHMMYGFGIPEQLKALGVSNPAILIPWDSEFECSSINEQFADAIIGLKSDRLSKNTHDKPRLGVFLETSDKGVLITKVIKGSVAEVSKIKANDVIIQLAGQSINKVEEVIKIVQAMQPGTLLPITVNRNDETINIIAKFPAFKNE